jgi:hypothetical protein
MPKGRASPAPNPMATAVLVSSKGSKINSGLVLTRSR